ncbi:hypothetical protein HCN44_009255 [Aphidius gifuensis]|uniref:ANKLE2 third alpha/beta domain-containing protein n=1 Tax=Aphidius gifuensis TaxID=684658 RepID=A0A834Y4U3_APHGI|nr:ankyrin repeat and LEM domain-containing protein 2 [Aphidius gifuensis]KAF7997857.1 hypothetical protein HCN44_009255 [Aphidius gifuensis]
MSEINKINDNKNCQKINENDIKNIKCETGYHAVYVPQNDSSKNTSSSDVHIYTNKLDALKDMKKNKSARLMTFKTLQEAEEFTKNGYEQNNKNINNKIIPVIQVTSNNNEPSLFKGPTSQELVAFRKLIEAGLVDDVKEQVWNNPRYLISSGDTPAILQEGSRYNAVHITAIRASNNVVMLKLILDIVSDPKFSGLMYGKDEDNERAQILLDLYLNTPDKGLNETPLHFAVKYGHKDLVKLLLSYPQCQKNKKNKYGQLPSDIVCSRKGKDDETLVKDISLLLEDQYYVPVLRAEDNILQPRIGEPFLPISPPRLNLDPLSPKIEVAAFAGPMTKPQAMEFRKKWKTPPRRNLTPNDNKENLNNSFDYLTSPRSKNPTSRYQDSEKGLERVGRDLAEEYHVAWKELWPFLDGFVDLRCAEGLAMLEKHLNCLLNKVAVKTKKSRKSENSVKRWLFDDDDEKIDDVDDNDNDDEIEKLAEKLGMCSLGKTFEDSSDSDDDFHTPSSSPLPKVGDHESDSSDDDLVEAEEGDAVFIDGKAPGKNDFAVLNAIPDFIDSEIYPYIYRWKHEVQLATRRNNFTFATPRKLHI